ncbi:acyltransferase [Novosphingobium sp. MD-1]|uniref:acyltransferase family protein n=1 Tax=Novosphingobium sp. MD-1 TaxID=1630648 RepID=UPI000F7E58AA|nr:acyltransferase [Novosphingobium sp. MD-1]
MHYRPQLDGLRAFAVSGVLYAHFVNSYSSLGHCGVQLFFVISGFLITGMLLDGRGDGAGGHRLPLRNFYARRSLRLWPIYYLVTILAIVADLDDVRASAPWHLLFATNLYFWSHQTWEPWVLDHYWSLGIEEQFYIVWPFLIYMAPRRALSWIIPLIAVLSWLALMIARQITWLGDNDLLGMLLPFSLVSLSVGGLLALWDRQPGRALAWLPVAGPVAALVWLAIYLWEGGNTGTALLFEAITWMALVHGAARGFSGAGRTVFEWSPLRYIGRISYGIYLYHNFVLYALGSGRLFGLHMQQGLPALLLGTAITIAVAALSWHLIELPINRLKRYFPFAAPVAPREGRRASEPSPAKAADLP